MLCQNERVLPFRLIMFILVWTLSTNKIVCRNFTGNNSTTFIMSRLVIIWKQTTCLYSPFFFPRKEFLIIPSFPQKNGQALRSTVIFFIICVRWHVLLFLRCVRRLNDIFQPIPRRYHFHRKRLRCPHVPSEQGLLQRVPQPQHYRDRR